MKFHTALCNTATQSGIWHCYQNQFDEKTDLNSFLQRSTMILHFRQNVIEHNVSLTATAINYHFYSAPALQKSIIFCNEPIIKVAQRGKTRNSLIFRQTNSLLISLVKTLLSRKSCWTILRVNLHNFHTV